MKRSRSKNEDFARNLKSMPSIIDVTPSSINNAKSNTPSRKHFKTSPSIEIIDVVRNSEEPGTSTDLNNNIRINNNNNNDEKAIDEMMKTLKVFFPRISNLVIRSFLDRAQAYNRHSNECMRIVCDELLKYNTDMESNSEDLMDIKTNGSNRAGVSGKTKAVLDYEKIARVITDCVPDYIHVQLSKLKDDPMRVENIISKMIEDKSYPKLKDLLEKEKREKERKDLLNLKIDFEEFHKMYPDPVQFFYDTKSTVTESYKTHCVCFLKNKCRYLSIQSIHKTLESHNFHFTPAHAELCYAYCLQEERLVGRINNHLIPHRMSLTQNARLINEATLNEALRNFRKIEFTKNYKKYKLENVMHPPEEYPDNLDEGFFRELFFVKNQSKILAFIRDKNLKKEQRREQAQLLKQLIECSCCYDDTLLEEDMLKCPDGHAFCKVCIKRYAETTIGDSKFKFKCIDDTCKSEFSVETLRQVLTENLFNNMLKNKQNEEIKNAGIENLESCQFCPYAAIIENPDEKIFTCLNPSCMRETCRLCKEPNHLPLRCEENKKEKSEVDFRTFIETRVTEAMLRTCWKCSKRFFKTEGCNMMHCVCGAAMCYICREPIKNYDHFRKEGGTCAQDSDVAELHKIEMEKALKEANEIYLKKNPNAAQLTLKNFDPKKMIHEATKKTPQQLVQELRIAQIRFAHLQQLAAEANNIPNIQLQIDQLMARIRELTELQRTA